MAAKTLHVYHSDDGWALKREGKRAETFGAKREAVASALHRARSRKAAQIAVYGKNGWITVSGSTNCEEYTNEPFSGWMVIVCGDSLPLTDFLQAF